MRDHSRRQRSIRLLSGALFAVAATGSLSTAAFATGDSDAHPTTVDRERVVVVVCDALRVAQGHRSPCAADRVRK